jgi:RNA polymerase sigma factor (sigma-70 family)
MELSGKVHPDIQAGLDEAALIARARQGDQQAWTSLVRWHQEPVFRLAYLMLSRGRETAAQAEDVAQETFVRAYLKLHQFEDGRPLRPWLLAIAANLARNRRRSIGRYWAALRRWMKAERAEHILKAPTEDQHDHDRLLWEAISQLPASHQQALYLRYFMELGEAEMAQALNVAPGTVKSRLHRARKALEAVLKDEFPSLYEAWHG